MFETNDGDHLATIPILELEKNSTRNKVRGSLTLGSFDIPSLDPVLYLKAYLDRTCEARSALWPTKSSSWLPKILSHYAPLISETRLPCSNKYSKRDVEHEQMIQKVAHRPT